jgi:hypothetical protein
MAMGIAMGLSEQDLSNVGWLWLRRDDVAKFKWWRLDWDGCG